MKETFDIWKKILTKPSSGYKEIHATTNLLRPLLLVAAVTMIAGLLMVPVVMGNPYAGAHTRASLDAMQKLGQLSDPGAREKWSAQLAAPEMRTINAVTAVLVPPLNLVLILIGGSILLWFVCLAVRNRLSLGVLLRLLTFTWLIPALGGVLQVFLVMIADQAALFGKVRTFLDLTLVQITPFSLAILFPQGSVSLLVILIIDFLTNIVNVIFYVLLFLGIRSLAPDKRPWKTAVPVGVFFFFNFVFVVGRLVLLSWAGGPA